MKHFPTDTQLLLYEEIKPDMIDEIQLNQTCLEAEIGNGDIICFQKAITPEQYEYIFIIITTTIIIITIIIITIIIITIIIIIIIFIIIIIIIIIIFN